MSRHKRLADQINRGADRFIYSVLGLGKVVFVMLVLFLFIWFVYAIAMGV